MTALVFGASGLVGTELLKQLTKDNRYSEITAIVRRPLDSPPESDIPIIQKVENFEKYEPLFQRIIYDFNVDHVYVCLGTTMKKAGNEVAFIDVDYDLIFRIASMAQIRKVTSLVWVSSVGADPKSKHFYLRVKGRLEEEIYKLDGLHATAVRPSLLLGERREKRLAESIGIFFATKFSSLMTGKWARYRPIHASEVATQMIELQRFDQEQ